ncbi:MAG: biopolymer transporter ExbD [Methylococcales bacterium]|nr:biopolymer transporter ExbD [Methylococcales bacterium]
MRFQRKKRQNLDITLISMIDVLFVLLLFFMVSTTFNRNTELNIKLPQANGAEAESHPKMITLSIDANGAYTLTSEDNVPHPVADQQIDTLKQALHNVSVNKADIPFVISADGKTPHQAVITALEAASNEGFTHLTFAAQKPTSQP